MEALNAVRLTPISVPRRPNFSPSTFFPLKFPISANFTTNPPNISEGFSKGFQIHGGLVILSSILNTGFARALTYEEALQQSVSSGGNSDIDAGGVLDSIINFGTENPAVIIGGAALLVVPRVLSQFLSKPKAWGVESAKSAYAKLGDDANAQLIDIRETVEIRKMGSPDIGGLKKKPVPIVYIGEDKPGFLKKLALKFKEPENTTLLILDKFDGNSELVAELVTANGFKAAYAIKDGAEGPRGWMNSSLPWLLPKKTFSLDFSSFTDSIGSPLGEPTDALPVTLGIAAAAGLGLLAFSEIETLLQVLGSAALVQLITKKLLFAEDRKKTLQQVDEFLSTKIAPTEFVDDIKEIGTAFLPANVTSKSLPAPSAAAEASPVVTTTTTDNTTVPIVEAAIEDTVQIVEAAAAATEDTVQKVEAAAATFVTPPPPPPIINSVPEPEISRPLSPFPYYPDFKPPTSPSPSQP